jgi:hypothetical protein
MRCSSPPSGRIGLEDEPEGANLWEAWGTYRLTSRRTPAGWRLDGFCYYSKLTRGNDAVRTHPA